MGGGDGHDRTHLLPDVAEGVTKCQKCQWAAKQHYLTPQPKVQTRLVKKQKAHLQIAGVGFAVSGSPVGHLSLMRTSVASLPFSSLLTSSMSVSLVMVRVRTCSLPFTVIVTVSLLPSTLYVPSRFNSFSVLMVRVTLPSFVNSKTIDSFSSFFASFGSHLPTIFLASILSSAEAQQQVKAASAQLRIARIATPLEVGGDGRAVVGANTVPAERSGTGFGHLSLTRTHVPSNPFSSVFTISASVNLEIVVVTFLSFPLTFTVTISLFPSIL